MSATFAKLMVLVFLWCPQCFLRIFSFELSFHALQTEHGGMHAFWIASRWVAAGRMFLVGIRNTTKMN